MGDISLVVIAACISYLTIVFTIIFLKQNKGDKND